MAISDERFEELVEYYGRLKEAIIKVDNKYSVDYVEPQLNFAPTLGLVPLEFTAKTEEELMTQAQTEVAPEFVAKRARETEDYTKRKDAFAQKQTEIERKHQKLLEQLLADYNTATTKLYFKLVNNGLLYSSVNTDKTNDERKKYTDSVHSATADYEDELDNLSMQLSKLDAYYEYNLSQLEEEENLKVHRAYAKLVANQEKQKLAIDKYNQTLTEKEVKYQASCQKAYQYARQAEYERALEASRLYAEIGESGIKQMMVAEKTTVAKSYFMPLSLEEANCILQMDGFLVNHLGTNYSSFVDWINVTLN